MSIKQIGKKILYLVIGFLVLVIIILITGEDTNTEYRVPRQYKAEETPVMEKEDWKESFVWGCTKDGANKEFCTCTYDELRKKYTNMEIAKMGLRFMEEGKVSEGFSNAVSNCLSKLEY